jgi:hypothetical protein
MSTDVVTLVRERLQESYDHDRDNRIEAGRDLEFLAGNQWDAAVRQEREQSGRPMLTINKLPQFVLQVVNDLKQADLAIKVSPVDDRSDPALAEIYNGLLRQIQYQSSAKHVYGTAVSHEVACGIGHWRVVTEYADESSFDQELKLKPVPHPLSVYWDPAATEPDRSDASWCIVTQMIPTKAFREAYPDAAETGVDAVAEYATSSLFWASGDEVRIAEYWERVPVKRQLVQLENGDVVDLTGWTKDQYNLLPIKAMRESTGYTVRQRLVSGAEELTKVADWPGKFIPIVPVLGGEIPLEKRVVRHGIVRYARDPQQLYNYYRTAAAEAIALAPKSPYLVTTTMIQHPDIKQLWDTANTRNRPYLPFNPDPAMPSGPKREHPPEMPAAFMQEAQIAAEDMKAVTGIYDAALGARSNETSGRAIMARDRQGDTANYHYADNLERSLWHTGRILLDLIPKIYDSERVVRLLGEDESEQVVRINQVTHGEDGVPQMLNDISAARFDVRVSIGRSYTTKRQESAEAMFQFLQTFPPAAPVIGDLVAKAQDWPGAEEIAKRLKNMVPPQALADPENPQVPQPPSPMDNPMMRLEIEGKMQTTRKLKADADAAEAGVEQTKRKQMAEAFAAEEAAKTAQIGTALKLRELQEPREPPVMGARDRASPAL